MTHSLNHLGTIWCRSEPYIKVALEKDYDIHPIGSQTYRISPTSVPISIIGVVIAGMN